VVNGICYYPSTTPWTARPDGSGRWDNRMATHHLSRDLVEPSSHSQIQEIFTGRQSRAFTGILFCLENWSTSGDDEMRLHIGPTGRQIIKSHMIFLFISISYLLTTCLTLRQIYRKRALWIAPVFIGGPRRRWGGWNPI